jgi:pyridoxamine 5'-phosphate oxidase
VDISHLREHYSAVGLSETDLHPDPIEQFAIWFQPVLSAGLREPNAMTLATCTPDGQPSARMVLLKGFDARGFVFYTNYESRKARELDANPRAALVFYWAEFGRQVRVEGDASRVSREESDEYFHSRPLGSQLGAWASHQSAPVASRSVLEEELHLRGKEFEGDQGIPLPPFWGGYRVTPKVIEFWQGRPNRLHDRLRYSRLTSGEWMIERLYP